MYVPSVGAGFAESSLDTPATDAQPPPPSSQTPHPARADGGGGTDLWERRAALAINLALHPDEPDGGVCGGQFAFWPGIGPEAPILVPLKGRDTHRFTQSLARWNKTGNQSVLRFS